MDDNHKKKQKGELNMLELREKMKAITRSIFGGQKEFVQLQNAFFTPPSIARDMIEFSGIGTTASDILFLEPTAGAGYLIADALGSSKKVFCDAIENIEPLAKFLDEFPRTRVWPYRNYFDLPDTAKYRVIIMNPPFNIPKGKALKSRAAKDVDFVLSAWEHLTQEGIMVCLISSSFEFRGIDKPKSQDARTYGKFRELLENNSHSIVKYDSGFDKHSELKEMKTGTHMRLIKILKKK